MNSATAPRQNDGNLLPLVYRPCARIYRSSFRENKPKTLVFNDLKTSVLELVFAKTRSIIRALVPYPNSQIRNTEAPQVNTDPSRSGSATMGRRVSPDLYVIDPDPNPRFTEVEKSEEIFRLLFTAAVLSTVRLFGRKPQKGPNKKWRGHKNPRPNLS
jgi:hypothetical protein